MLPRGPPSTNRLTAGTSLIVSLAHRQLLRETAYTDEPLDRRHWLGVIPEPWIEARRAAHVVVPPHGGLVRRAGDGSLIADFQGRGAPPTRPGVSSRKTY